ncbi:phage portal protein [Rhizobium sp. CFBP 8762]|uniref:phage portal protein n=1 Tax=Rhizobium sp. CFBP 8762 TaxID=2775279 RepID=UPI0017861F76|nr:phage portal protein [Rhizobium sp. CFBP 8762]MBD8555544.1 phage portal protein [Rhizobium sp. CFBP 8762]
MITKPKVRRKAGSQSIPAAIQPSGGVQRATSSYLRDTRSGVIQSRPAFLREHRDDIRQAWDRSAALAMDLIQNSGRLKGACDQIIADTVGTELTLNPQPDLTGLGYDDKERADLINLIKRRWKMYAWNPAECDLRGKLTIPQMADIGIRWFIAYGESTGVLSYMSQAQRRRYGITTGTKMLMVPPHRLSQETRETEGLYQGVFHDENGRATHYRFNTRESGVNVTADYAARDARGRSLVLHAFDPMDATDVRGISLLAPTFRKHIQHEILDDATLQMAVLQTIYAICLTSEKPSADAFEALEALSAIDGASPLATEFLNYFSGSLNAAAESSISVNGDPTVSHFAPGEKLSFESVKVPGGEYLPFADSLSRDMARALGITFGGLTMNYSQATYSSVRMETSSLWPVVLRRRERIAAPHYQMPYESWLDEEIGEGRIPFKGGYEAFDANRDRVCWALWQGPAKPTADDGKAAKAATERISNGTTTLAQECADLGLDADEVFQQREIEHKRYINAGMPSPFMRNMPSDPASADDDDEPVPTPQVV